MLSDIRFNIVTSLTTKYIIMKNRIFLILTLVFLTSFLSIHKIEAQSVTSKEFSLLAAKADTMLNDAIQHEEHVGLTAGIFADGQIAWTGGAGYRNLKSQAPANGDMVNRIASISKSMTAVAIMQLVEKGKVDLDASLQTYVADYPIKPEGEITIRQLLTHTSGVPHYKGSQDGFSRKEYKNLNKAMNRFKKRDLKGTPGKLYQYTTYGYVLLGLVIEKSSGMSYETYMKKNIWDVAGMYNTSVEHKKQKVTNKSRFYKMNKKGRLKKDIKSNLSMKVPGGGIQSTAGDLLKFGQAIFDHKLISKETLDKMFYDPKLKGRGNPYIFGFFLYADDERGRIIGHSGSQVGTSTQMMILLDKGIVVSCLSNTREQWGKVHNLTWQLIELALNKESREEPIRRAILASNTQLDRFLGTFDFGKDQILIISRKGEKLFSKMNDNPTLQLYVQNDSTIFYRDFNARFEFEFDDQKEQIVKTTYVQNGKTSIPKKIK